MKAKEGEKEAAGLLVGLLEKEPEKKKAGAETEEGEGEGDEEKATMKAARVDSLRAFKEALMADDFEGADEAWGDYQAAC